MTDITWAAEEAADVILDIVERASAPMSSDKLDARFRNLLTKRAGKHRRRAAIKAVHYDPPRAGASAPSFFDEGAARARLRELETASRPADWSLLVGVGLGAGMAEIAVALGSTETAVKKRVARARERIPA